MKYIGPVRFILKGDTNLAMRYTGLSRLLLQQAKDRMGSDKAYWNRTLPDGTEIIVSSLGGVNQIWITSSDTGIDLDLKQGYLILSAEGDKYYPIYKYTPYQAVNENSTDTEAGNIEWVGRDNRILSWAGGSNRYTESGTGTSIYYRGSKYSDAPNTVTGAAIASSHIIVTTVDGKMYHRPFTPTGYDNSDIYDEDTASSGWREIYIGALPLSGISSIVSADYTGLKWTGRHGDTKIYDWVLEFNSETSTFSVSGITDTDLSSVNINTVDEPIVFYVYSGDESSTTDDTDYTCFTGYRSHIFEGRNEGRQGSYGDYRYYIGSDFDPDGNLLTSYIEEGEEFFVIDYQGYSYLYNEIVVELISTPYGTNPDFYYDTQRIYYENNIQYSGNKTKLSQKWTIGNLKKQNVLFYVDIQERLISNNSPVSTDTTEIFGPFPSPVVCLYGAPPNIPTSELDPYREEVTISSSIYQNLVLYEDIRYSSAVYVEYTGDSSYGDTSIIWETAEEDYTINIQIDGRLVYNGNVPFNLAVGLPLMPNKVFVSEGASDELLNLTIHHIDIVPDSNDLLLFIDITFYGERITRIYSKKNAGQLVTDSTLTLGSTIDEIKAL